MDRDILLIQKRELERRLKESFVEREVDLNIQNDMIKVIAGPRRAGKSFFAVHMLSRLGNFGYVNFDDEKLVEVKDYNEIVDAVNSVYHKPKYLLLDEVQNLERWELFVNRLQRQGYNLVVTGSNSRLLSRELATHLTGRHLVTNIFPFSFREFIGYKGKELTKSEIKTELGHYLTHGGFPEPLVKGLEFRDYLSTLFSSVIYKDIVKRYRIRAIRGIEDLASYLTSNIAREFSLNTLTRVTKCKSVHTIERYLNYLEEAFMFFKVSRFSPKVKEQVRSNKKIYCIDNGFICAKAFKLSSDIGRLYENAVAVELKKLELKGEAEIYYWKGTQQEEVDFVVKSGLKIRQLIQVCYHTSNLKTRNRETRALVKASKELKCRNLMVITEGQEGEKQVSWFGVKRKIKFLPLWKYLTKNIPKR